MKANNYTGKNFEWEIRKSLDDISCWWFRIQDTNDVSRFVKKAIAEKQPGDFFAVKDGIPILIECKTGGQAWFFIRKDIPRNKRVFALTPYQLDAIYCDATKKSVKWDVIETIGIELPRLSKPVRYDLTELLNRIKDCEQND